MKAKFGNVPNKTIITKQSSIKVLVSLEVPISINVEIDQWKAAI